MLERLRIGPKLLLAPCMVLLLLVACCGSAWHAMERQNQALEMIVNERAARIREAGELASEARQAHARIYQLLTWIGASFSAPRVEALGQDVYQRHAAIEREFAALERRTAGSPPEQRFVKQAGAAHATYVRAILDVIELSQVDHSMSANAMSKAETAFAVVAQRLEQLARFEQELSEQASTRAGGGFAALSVLMPLLVALAVGATFGITMLVRRALLGGMAGIGAAAGELASGRLIPVNRRYGRDEIADTARTLDAAIGTLNASLTAIAVSARSIDTASRDIARGSAALSGLAQALLQAGELAARLGHASAGQADGIGEARQALLEMDRMTRQNAALVNDAAAAAQTLQAHALVLSQTVDGFQLDERAADAAGPPKKAAPHLRLASRRP